MRSQLRLVSEGLWEVRTNLSVGPGMVFPLRMSIVRLSGGGLLLFSPVDCSDELAGEISALGPVEEIIAPSLLHHLFAEKAKQRFPEARLWAAPGLKEKRAEIAWDGVLTGETPEHLQAELDFHWIQGSPDINEVVMFHKPTRSLFVVDLLFNIHETSGFLSPLVFRLVGAHRRLAQSKLWRWVFTKDRSATRRSVQDILRWEFDRLVPCHGEVVESDARTLTTKALSWMLGGEEAASALLSAASPSKEAETSEA